MSRLVNHGAPVVWNRHTFVDGSEMLSAGHDGASGHQFLGSDEQCECGTLGIGLAIELDDDYEVIP